MRRMYVKSWIVGKAYYRKIPDIKGRGRMGWRHIPKSSLKLTLEEKSAKDFYKLTMEGKTPPSVAHVYK
jgi:ribosomal protein L22